MDDPLPASLGSVFAVRRKEFPVPVRRDEESLQDTVNGKQNVPESDPLDIVKLNGQLDAKAGLVGAVDNAVGLEGDTAVPFKDVPRRAEDKHNVKAKVPVEVAVNSRPF